MLALFTTARKALAAAIVATIGPLVALLQADDPLTLRGLLVAGLSGLAAGVATWATVNEPAAEVVDDEPGEHAVDR